MVTVVVAAEGGAWEASLLAAAESHDLGIAIVRRCMDVVELVSVALSGQARVALISSRLRDMDADVVDQLRVAGVVPVAVITGDDDVETETMQARGIRYVVSSVADATVMANVVREAFLATDDEPERRPFYSLPGPQLRGQPDVPQPESAAERAAPGTVVAVWGPAGAPGRSTVAAGLADEMARLGADVVLVDADVYGGTLATRLGVLDESPGIAAACRIASSTLLDEAALAGLCWQVGPRLRLLSGIPLAQRWPEVRPVALESVLRIARSLGQWVVVDLGFSVEADEELAFDALVPRRNGVTISVLEAADRTLVVGEADPVGLQRLTYALLELEEGGLGGDAQIVLNKARAGFGSGDPAGEAGEALERFTARRPLATLPYDRDAMDACLAGGRSLAEVRPRSRLRQSFVQLACDLTGIEPTGRASRHARARRRPRIVAG